ncbi:MAG: DUF932 domain-containing protein [Nitrospira sp.]
MTKDPTKESEDDMLDTNTTTTRDPWVFGARDNRHRGVEVDNDGQPLTVSQAIKVGGLDWLVELRSIRSDDDDQVSGEDFQMSVKVEDGVKDGALVREHKVLGVVKGRYTVLQNRDAFAFFDRATLEGAAIIKAVGHLDHGRVVWAVAERPDGIELYPGVTVRPKLILLTAHDGSHAVKVMFSANRDDTGTMLGVKPGRGRNVRTEVRVRHTKSIDDRMLDLHNVLAAESDYFERWRAALLGTENRPGLKQRIVTQDEIQKVVSGLFPAQTKKDEDGKSYEDVSTRAANARKLIEERIAEQTKTAQEAYAAAGQEAPQGVTALDVFLGVSEFVANDRTAKNEGNSWVVSTFGTGSAMRQKAFDLITGM